MTTISRRRFNKALAASGLGLAATMYSPGIVFAQRKGGTLTFVVSQEPPGIVSVGEATLGGQIIRPKYLEGLFRYDFDMKPIPQLATAYKVSSNGLEYEFDLRQGVKWHDGKDFTSADVEFSIRLAGAVHPRGRSSFSQVKEILTPTPHKVILKLANPAPYLISAFAAHETSIVPRHLYEPAGLVRDPGNIKPTGTGPFIFKEWVKGSHVTLERNPNYWDGGKPYLDRVVFRFIPDASARMAALESGDVDIGGNNPVPLHEIKRLTDGGKLTVETRGYSYLNANAQLIFNLSRPQVSDVRVRKAIAHAIDLNVIKNVVWYGFADIQPSPIGVDARYADPSVKAYPFDLTKAEQLLDEAGFKRDASGKRFSLSVLYGPYMDSQPRTADYLKQALAKVGINVEIRAYDFATFLQEAYVKRDFDINAEQLAASFDPTAGVQRLFWSQNIKEGLIQGNSSHYRNAEVDRLFEAASLEPNEERRRKLFYDVQKILMEELPVVNMVAPQYVTVVNKRVVGHTVDAAGPWSSFAEAYVM